jgi:hypothetical protein
VKQQAVQVFAVLISLLLLVQVVSPAAGSDLHIYVDPSGSTASWSSEIAEYINITGGNISDYTKAAPTGFSLDASVNMTTALGVKDEEMMNQTISDFNDSVQVFYLTGSLNLTASPVAAGMSILAVTWLNMSLRWLPNTTSGEYNMTWKSFNFNGTLNSLGSNGAEINMNSPAGYFENVTALSPLNSSIPYLQRIHVLDFEEFSYPLSDWTRTSASSGAQTVYSFNAAPPNDIVLSIPSGSGNGAGNYTLSLHEDPSAVIVFKGSSYAIGNTIYAVSPPGPSFEEAAIATAIIAVSIFSIYAIAARRGRSGKGRR